MTLDEALGKVTDPEVKAFFQKMIADQNSYITKLETINKTQVKQTQEQPSNDTVAGMNKVTYNYLQEKMREDIINKSTAIITQNISQEMFNAVKPDWEAFLQKNMNPNNTKEYES